MPRQPHHPPATRSAPAPARVTALPILPADAALPGYLLADR